WIEPAEREKRHVSNALFLQFINQRIVGSMGDIISILYANNWHHLSGVFDLFTGNVAQTNVTDEALLSKFGQRGQRPFQRSLGWSVDVKHTAQVHDIEYVEFEIAQIIMHGQSQLFA